MDDSLGEAHAALAFCHYCYDWDWSAAERGFKRAIELNPDYALAHAWYAALLYSMARFEEAIAEARRARELVPLSMICNGVVGVALMMSRRYDEAIDEFQKILDMDPGFYLARVWLGMTYYLAGEAERTRAALKQAALMEVDNTYALGVLGWGLGITGEEKAALEILNKLEELSSERYVSVWYRAIILGALGRSDEAFELFEDALNVREPQMTTAAVIPAFDILRPDPRFQSLLRRTGLGAGSD
jgi:tetratricopeptide (TPR) repeat protein